MRAEASEPALSLLIPSLNGARRLPVTLKAIACQEIAGPVEVVVVDDGSSDGTAEAAAAAKLPWGPVQVVRHPEPKGRAAACNSGIRASSAPVVVILDDDMTLQPGALEAHRAFHAAGAGRAALGRIVLAPPERDTCFTRFLEREQANRERILLASQHDVPFPQCLTGHFSAPRPALVETGGFDERITRYGFEDIELGYRLSRRGVKIAYLPGAVSVHRSYMTDLDRYLERHVQAGLVAADLARRHPDGPFREYLRVDGPAALGVGRDPAGLVALRLLNRLLLRPWLRRAAGSRPGFAALRALLRAWEAARLDRLAHFGYHVARDIRYFQGYFGERSPEGPG